MPRFTILYWVAEIQRCNTCPETEPLIDNQDLEVKWRQ